MKLTKKLLILASLSMGLVANAQDRITNDDGVEILPESGQFAIGFNAVPLLNIIGNATAGGNKFINNMFSQNSIYGKYMLDESTAIRANLNIGFSNFNNRNFVFNDAVSSPDSLVTDRITVNSQTFMLGGGYEFRKGEGRVQAIFGGDLGFMFQRSTRSYSYGNDFGTLNQTATSTNWSNDGQVNGVSSQGQRLVENIAGNSFGVGLRPFVGIEYFFAPKISIGAEFGWNIMYMNTSDGESVTEYYSPSLETVIEERAPSAGSNGFNGAIDNLNGAVTLMFYF